MNNLVIDMTHGGVKIAINLAKKGRNVLAFDIYDTLNAVDKRMLEVYDIYLLGSLEDLKDFKGEVRVISPVHLPLTHDEIIQNNSDLKYTFITHHEAVLELLDGWGEDIPKVEVTGVKGKTSSVFMLKEILIDSNPLILSSLGAILYEDKNEIILKKNISITPANIKETIDLAYKVANPVCKIAEGVVESENLKKYSAAVFESSLGVSGIGDVGLLTNISENYPIAKNHSCAAEAKKQVFRCPCVAIEKECYDKYYSDVDHKNVNTFSTTDESANLHAESVNYSLDRTEITVKYNNVCSINDNILNGNLTVETFAPGIHHVSNVLGVILTCICLEIDEDKIISGLTNYNGITGRSKKRSIENSTVIEEINPGINTDTIKKSVEMIQDIDCWNIAIGGDYGITCEEIDEDKVASYLNTIDADFMLTGPLGKSLSEKISKNIEYIENYKEIYDLTVKENKNLLFIYRSDYRQLSQR